MDHRPGLLERVTDLLERVTDLLQRPGGGQIVGFCHSHPVSLCVTTSHGPGRPGLRRRCHNDAH